MAKTNIDQALSDKLSRQIATINSWPELEKNFFLSDHPKKALQLVLALKHYANPLAGYPLDTDADEAMRNVANCLTDPKQLQAKSTEPLSADEIRYLTELLRIKLDQMAAELIVEHKIKPATIQKALLDNIKHQASTPTPPPAETHPSTIWWNNLTPAEQQRIKNQYETGLDAEQRQHLERRTYDFYRPKPTTIVLLPCYYHQMCINESELNYFRLRHKINMTLVGLDVMLQTANLILTVASFSWGNRGWGKLWGSSGRNNNKDNSAALVTLLAVLFASFLAASLALYNDWCL